MRDKTDNTSSAGCSGMAPADILACEKIVRLPFFFFADFWPWMMRGGSDLTGILYIVYKMAFSVFDSSSVLT